MAIIRKLIPGDRDVRPPRSEVDAYYQVVYSEDGTPFLYLYNYAESPGPSPTQSFHLDRATAESLTAIVEIAFPNRSSGGSTKSSTLAALRAFAVEREWDQFHSPENLAKSISIEAAELLELYQWGQEPDQQRVEEELADVLTYCFQMATRLGVDIDDIVLSKLEKTRLKYPVELSRDGVTKRPMPEQTEP